MSLCVRRRARVDLLGPGGGESRRAGRELVRPDRGCGLVLLDPGLGLRDRPPPPLLMVSGTLADGHNLPGLLRTCLTILTQSPVIFT